MKAWQFNGTHKPFERVDIPEPTIESGKVVIDVKAAGLCHSDVGILEDEKWLENMVVPVVPGHETAGVISEVADDVTDWKVGDRVAVWPLAELQGYMVNGAWADKTIVSMPTEPTDHTGWSGLHRGSSTTLGYGLRSLQSAGGQDERRRSLRDLWGHRAPVGTAQSPQTPPVHPAP